MQCGRPRAGAGRDWKWEKRSLREYTERATTNFDCDIVFSDGTFVTYPEGVQTDHTNWPAPQQTTTTPVDPKALFEQATSLYRSDHFNEAIPVFEQYLQKNPNDALANARIGMSTWRDKLFIFLSRNARRATNFFQVPPDRVVEIGIQLEI